MRSCVAAVVLAAVVSLSGCGGDSADPVVSGPDGDIHCADVVTGEEGAALGWTSRTNVLDVEADDDGCHLDYRGLGSVTVGELAGTSAAKSRVEKACAGLTVDEDLTAALIGGGTGCVTGLDPSTETGEAQLVLLTQDGSAVRITVDAQAPVDDSHLRAAFRTLTRAAQKFW